MASIFTGFSDTDANGILNTWLGGVASAAPSTWYVGLLNTLPSDSVGSGLAEPWLVAPAISTITSVSTGGSIAPGTRYYQVTAVNASGETTASAEMSYTVPSGTSTNVVTVSWGAVSGAVTYNVYESGTSGSEGLIASGISTTYYQDDGTTTTTITAVPGSPGDNCSAVAGADVILSEPYFGEDLPDVYNGVFRFPTVDIPAGATVTVAYLSLYYGSHIAGSSGDVIVTIEGDKELNPAQVRSVSDYDGRPVTSATVAWTQPYEWTGYAYTPDISTVVQELIDQAGWEPGNAMQIFVADNGSPSPCAVAPITESGPAYHWPLLVVTYSTAAIGPPTTNTTGYGYQRVPVAANTTNFPSADGRAITNGATFTFPVPTAGWGVCPGIALFDGPQSDATFRAAGYLASPLAEVIGTPPYLGPGAFTIPFV